MVSHPFTFKPGLYNSIRRQYVPGYTAKKHITGVRVSTKQILSSSGVNNNKIGKQIQSVELLIFGQKKPDRMGTAGRWSDASGFWNQW
jgi:hypothetical protein